MKKKNRRAPRGSGSVRLRKDGLWEARFSFIDSEGRRRQQSAYGKTREVALSHAAERRRDQALCPSLADAMRFDDYLRSWLRVKREECSGATYLLYRLYVEKRLIPALGKHALGSLRREHVIGLLDQLAADGVGAPTRAAIFKTVRAALESAVARELMPRNVAATIRPPRVKRKPFYIPSESELCAVLRAAQGDRYEALYALGTYTSMRQAEIFGLQWKAVNLADGYLRVETQLGVDAEAHLVIKGPKTEASYRRIELPRAVVNLLSKVPESERRGLVFTDTQGHPIRRSNFLRREFFPLLERAGVRRFRFHALRHASNSILLERGESLVVVKERGGWSSVRMPLEVYGHTSRTSHRRAVDTLDEILR